MVAFLYFNQLSKKNRFSNRLCLLCDYTTNYGLDQKSKGMSNSRLTNFLYYSAAIVCTDLPLFHAMAYVFNIHKYEQGKIH